MQEFLQDNQTSLVQAGVEATSLSIQEAEGDCRPSVPAAAWFWFLLETTIGHGNQGLQTQGGRALVYSLGFGCILAFAAFLGTSGYIIVALLEAALVRWWKKEIAPRRCILLVFWAALYYTWMILIAKVVQVWKERRLGLDDFALHDGYWFAFISTTTVGLGDYYLEPSVIVSQDLITFPLLFLIGFVFLAAFLAVMAEMLASIVPQQLRKDHLMQHLENADTMLEKNDTGEDEMGSSLGSEDGALVSSSSDGHRDPEEPAWRVEYRDES